MSEAYFDQVRERGECLSIRPSYSMVRFASGEMIDVLCDVETEITIEGVSYKTVFHVIPGLHHTAIIGRDIIKRYGMTISYEPDEEEAMSLDFTLRVFS